MLLAALRQPRRQPRGRGQRRRRRRERDPRAAALGASGPRGAAVALGREGVPGAAEPPQPAAHGGNLGAAAPWGPGSAAARGWAGGGSRLCRCSRGAASAPASAHRRAPRSRSRGGSGCVAAGGGAGGPRPVRSGRQRLLPPARRCRPASPLSSHLSLLAARLPPSPFIRPPPPPCSPSAGITCRHHTHWESLPRLSPRFRSNEDTWLPSSTHPPRSHRLLLLRAHHRADQTEGPQPQKPYGRAG